MQPEQRSMALMKDIVGKFSNPGDHGSACIRRDAF